MAWRLLAPGHLQLSWWRRPVGASQESPNLMFMRWIHFFFVAGKIRLWNKQSTCQWSVVVYFVSSNVDPCSICIAVWYTCYIGSSHNERWWSLVYWRIEVVDIPFAKAALRNTPTTITTTTSTSTTATATTTNDNNNNDNKNKTDNNGNKIQHKKTKKTNMKAWKIYS